MEEGSIKNENIKSLLLNPNFQPENPSNKRQTTQEGRLLYGSQEETGTPHHHTTVRLPPP